MSEKKINFVGVFEIIFAVIVILAGIVLRWKVWQTDLSFWVDEDALIRNAFGILDGKYPIWRGLEAEYSPPMFFALTKPLYWMFGLNEIAFRFLPFMASVLALLAMAVLSKKVLKTPFLFLLPLAILAVNENLLFYTQYYKFYATDFFVALLISIAVFYLSFDKMSYKQAALWGILSGVASWSAYSAIFYLVGIFGVLFVKILFNFSKEKFFKFLILSVPAGILTCWYYIEVIIRRTNLEWLKSAWNEIGNGYFYPHNYDDVFNLFHYHTALNFSTWQLWAFVALMVVGFVLMILKYKLKAIYFVSPCVVMLLLAFAGKYPFIERQTLFLLPMFLILIFKTGDFVDFYKNGKVFGIVSFCFLIVVANLWKTFDISYLREIWDNRQYFCMSTAREFYKHLETEYRQGDWVYSKGRDASLRIYDRDNNLINFDKNIEEVEDFDNFVKRIPLGSRVHIYIAEYPFVGDEFLKNYDFIKNNYTIIQEIKEPSGNYVLFRR